MKVEQGSDIRGDLELGADVVVVGSGAGGSVVACILAEAGQQVVLLEEGPYVAAEKYAAMRPSESLRHLFRDGGSTFALGIGDTPMINVTMGRCIGGSSVLTGGVSFRTPDSVLNKWVTQHGLTELTPDRMEPAFSEVETAIHVEEVPVSMRSLATERFAAGAASLGHPLKSMRRNTRGCRGCGRCNFGCPHGAKLGVDVTYLSRAVAARARVYSDVHVDRITLKGDRANGVVGRLPSGGRLTVRARRVVVACGAYHSPGLLRRSGVGRRSGQLGRNMTLHPGFRMMACFDEPVHGWRGALQSAYCDAFESDAITLTGLHVPPGVLAGMMPGIGPSFARRADAIPNLAVFGGMLHDEGGGTLHRWLGHTFATYRMAPKDRARIPQILKIMAETFFAGGAREVYLPVLGMPPVTADKLAQVDFEHIPGRGFECASQHPLGTCRMGTGESHSVVDTNGQTWDIEELFVADGSIIPTSLGVNPQLSIMAMATRIGWKLRERPPA